MIMALRPTRASLRRRWLHADINLYLHAGINIGTCALPGHHLLLGHLWRSTHLTMQSLAHPTVLIIHTTT